jgi:AcrR family transcriptional regulator
VASATTPDTKTAAAIGKDPAPASRRPELSRDRVVAAALALIDREGLEAMSMRRLADELGVGTMSLYHYVADKEDLSKAVLEVVLGDFHRPKPDEPWTDMAKAVASGFRASALAHPAAIGLLFREGRTSSASARWEDVRLGLAAIGATSDQIRRALRTISRFVIGWCMAEMLEINDRASDCRRNGDNDFVFALDVIVNGIQDRLD